jgi:hypothetical protein
MERDKPAPAFQAGGGGVTCGSFIADALLRILAVPQLEE